mmetsp:Transcript_11335/g.16942  ORF Transcript_11335/g.16942 Transcript_11335/m.16942 type:complete len:304 (-) Transcript_11335:217-1128(-)
MSSLLCPKTWLQIAAGFGAGAVAMLSLVHVWRPSTCDDKFDVSDLEFVYWHIRGLGEVPRMMLAFKGYYPGDYKSYRVKFSSDKEEKMTEAKSGIMISKIADVKDDLKENFGRMPFLKSSKIRLGQSVAINYYLASKLKLMGKDTYEAAQVLMIINHLRELKQAFYKMCPYRKTPDAKMQETFFKGGAKDSEGIADISIRHERYMSWFLPRLEKLIGDDGFAVGGTPTYADFELFYLFGDELPVEHFGGKEEEDFMRQPFYSTKLTNESLKMAPKVCKILEKIKKDKNIIKYMEVRGIPKLGY